MYVKYWSQPTNKLITIGNRLKATNLTITLVKIISKSFNQWLRTLFLSNRPIGPVL